MSVNMTSFTGLRLTSLLFLFGSCLAACPSNWTSYGGSCYHFSHDKLAWLGATIVCNMWQSDLVSIDSSGEQFFVQRTGYENGASSYWLGASDLNQEGVFIWQNSKQNLTFTFWEPGQPNNYKGQDNCVSMREDAHYAWKDDECTDERLYICEMRESFNPDIIG